MGYKLDTPSGLLRYECSDNKKRKMKVTDQVRELLNVTLITLLDNREDGPRLERIKIKRDL